MSGSHYAHCKRCRKPRTKQRPISFRGLCKECREPAMNANVDQMVDRRGPNWNRWRRGMILAAGGTITDPKLRD